MLKDILQICLKKFSWTCVINDLNGEEIIGPFYKKELQETNQEEFITEKGIKRKGDMLYIKWKGYDIFLIAELMKKTFYKMSQFFEMLKLN